MPSSPKRKLKSFPVSEFKARLLEIVRAVEKGESFEILKDKRPVARLIPIASTEPPVLGFAQIEIRGDLLDPLPADWTFDQANVKGK